jgi:hypothetical protein
MRLSVCLLVLCAASAALAARPASHTPANDDSPWFCHDLDCPKFTLVKNITDDVQLRKYAAGEVLRAYACITCSGHVCMRSLCLQHISSYPQISMHASAKTVLVQLLESSSAGCIG